MTVAYLALFSWPIAAFIAFRRYEVSLAILVTLIFGFLFLPTKAEVDLPLLPALNKYTIPAFTAFALSFIVSKNALDAPRTPSFIPRSSFARLCLITLIIGAFLTVITNGDPLVYGPTFLPGLRIYDAFSIILGLFSTLMPFVLAHKFLSHPDKQRLFLKFLLMAALLYSLLALYEVRLSPQLNNMVYGFFPNNFLQHIRGSGYRPLVFLNHGLVLAIFFALAILAAAGLTRLEEKKQKTKVFIAGLWLLVTLILCKSLGALFIALFLLPIALLLGVRMQLLIAAIFAVVIMTYPLLRSGGYIPVDRINAYAESIDPQRASSLRVRFENEDDFLEKIKQRPVFGWGGYRRSRVFTEYGVDTSIADGAWINTLGVGGWVRFLSQFGLFCLPMMLLFLNRRRLNISLETSIMALLLMANVIDLIPNSSQTPLTWMLAGSLWGRLSLGHITQGITHETPDTPTRTLQYARPRPAQPAPGVAAKLPAQRAHRSRQLVPSEHKG